MSPPTCDFSETSEEDLIEITLFVAAKESAARAMRFSSDLRAHCLALSSHPRRMRLCEEYGSGVRVSIFGSHLIFFTEKDGGILVERILHGADISTGYS